MAVTEVQRKWGPKALRKLETSTPAAEVPRIPTGFPALDQALGIGGIPRGRITEILGAPTSGMTTLALQVIAQAQAAGDTAIYVDLGYTFDPDYAACCGVNPAHLLLVRPRTAGEALEMVEALVASHGTGVLVFDSVAHLQTARPGSLAREPGDAQAMPGVLRRLLGPLAGSPCALIFLTPLASGEATASRNYPRGLALPDYAAVRLLLQRERWIYRPRAIYGYQARVTVLKNKLAAAGRQVVITITFNGIV